MKKIKLGLGFILVVIAILLIFLSIFRVSLPLENFFKKNLIPFQKKIYSLKIDISELSNFLKGKKKVIEENEELKKENLKLLEEKVKLEILKKENEILRNELNFLKKEKINYLIAEIIGKTPVEQILNLDQGEEKGIKVGFPVLSNGNLIGKIIKVDKYESQVLLLYSNYFSVASIILGKDEVTGLVKGEKGLTLKMDFILPEKEFERGNMVITSGWEENIPKGLLIGRVKEISYKKEDFFKKVLIQPLINFDEIKIVTVLIKK